MKPDVIDPGSEPTFPMRTPNITDVLRFTFCQRLLSIDLYPGSFEDPDGDVIHLSIPCSFGFGHDGLCEFPLPRRAVGR